jgi:fructokinase
VAVGLAKLGLQSVILSKIGLDFHGKYLLSCLNKENVDCSWVSYDTVESSSQCFMTRRKDGHPEYYSWPSPNASKNLEISDIKNEYFQDSWLWHAAAVSFIAKPRRFAMDYALNKAAETGKIISFDACFPNVESKGGRETAWNAMKKSDILKFNLPELIYWTNSEAGREIGEMVQSVLTEMSPAVLIVTLAEKGALIYSGGRHQFCSPYIVNSIGDVGPGDAFSAGLIYGMSQLPDLDKEKLYKLSIEQWLQLARYGACAGALVTRAKSATERFPNSAELLAAVGKTPSQS